MNTLNMLNAARGNKLSRVQLTAHILWALVSQAGMPPLAVGEITKLINLTSGIRPSAYQVKTIIEQISESKAVALHDGPNRGKGRERLYAANENTVAFLCAYVGGLEGSEILPFAQALIYPVRVASFEKYMEMQNYNIQLVTDAKESLG